MEGIKFYFVNWYVYYKLFYFFTNLTILHTVCFPTSYSITYITYILTATRTLNSVPPSKKHKTHTG